MPSIRKLLLLVGMVILFGPMSFFGWMVLGGKTTKPGMFTMDVSEPWNYFVVPAFILAFVTFYYMLKKYKEL